MKQKIKKKYVVKQNKHKNKTKLLKHILFIRRFRKLAHFIVKALIDRKTAYNGQFRNWQ